MASSNSIVEYLGGKEAGDCNYCHTKACSYSQFMYAYSMTVADYQDLIDRGWRRSGRYCYKPVMNRTCCPHYTIRCKANEYTMSKSAKKIVRKLRTFLRHGISHVVRTEVPRVSDGGNSEDSGDDDDHETGQRFVGNVDQPDGSRTVCAVIEVQQKKESVPMPRPGQGRDPDRPAPRKAKEIRRERAMLKQLAKGGLPDSSSKPKLPEQSKPRQDKAKNLRDLLSDCSDQSGDPKHKFEIRLVRADPSDKAFAQSFQESFQLYSKYQTTVHKDKPGQCTVRQYEQFLCGSPLTFRPDSDLAGQMNVPGYGSYHQQYLIDDRIVCVGVIDILPFCVSSVYLYYDPDYCFLSLGTLSSLFELSFGQSLSELKPELSYYYMGYYIHSCAKMRYKIKHRPSWLLCPETYEWQPVEKCLPLLDKSKYSRLADTRDGQQQQDSEDSQGVDWVLVLHRKQCITYKKYRRTSKHQHDDTQQVEEYRNLVGDHLSKTMLLYRP